MDETFEWRERILCITKNGLMKLLRGKDKLDLPSDAKILAILKPYEDKKIYEIYDILIASMKFDILPDSGEIPIDYYDQQEIELLLRIKEQTKPQ